MARVTVEDCILTIPNRFELVITAAQRAKQISSGSPLTQDRDNDKDAVVSLREIADETIDIDLVEEDMIQSFQKQFGFDRTDILEDDNVPAIESALDDEMARYAHTSFMEEQASEHYSGSLSFIEDNVEVDD